MKEQEKYPKGHWMGIGIAIGIGIGIPLGLIMGIFMDNISLGIALGPAIGVGLGSGIGAALEAKHKDDIRPMTEDEKKSKKIAVVVGIALLLAGLLILGYMFLSR